MPEIALSISSLIPATRRLTSLDARIIARRLEVMNSRISGTTQMSTSARLRWMRQSTVKAPSSVTTEMNRSSGPWCASSVTSNRSLVTRLISWPVLLRSKKEKVHLLQMGKQRAPHVRLDGDAHGVPEVGDDPLAEGAQEEKAQHGEARRRQQARGALRDVLIEHLPGDDGEKDIHQRNGQRADHVQQEDAQMGLIIRRELGQKRAAAFVFGRRLHSGILLLSKGTGAPRVSAVSGYPDGHRLSFRYT